MLILAEKRRLSRNGGKYQEDQYIVEKKATLVSKDWFDRVNENTWQNGVMYVEVKVEEGKAEVIEETEAPKPTRGRKPKQD